MRLACESGGNWAWCNWRIMLIPQSQFNAGLPAEFAVFKHLILSGYNCSMSTGFCTWDVAVLAPDGVKYVQVKWRRKENWTCRADFPYWDTILSGAHKEQWYAALDEGKPWDRVYIVSANLMYAVMVFWPQTREEMVWETRRNPHEVTRVMQDVYMVPKNDREHVKFIRLLDYDYGGQ